MSLQRLTVYRRAFPIILANASVPLLGIVDTAILGLYAGKGDLAALAIGATLFNLLFWNFGFLRMSTTGFIAQASDQPRLRTLIFLRSTAIAVAIGLALIVLQYPLKEIAFRLFSAPAEVESIAEQYFSIRIFAAPATLTLYCITGVLIGMGRSKSLLALQVSLNALNAGLNCLFVIALDYGMPGLAWGTVISEYLLVFCSLLLMHHHLFAVVPKRAERYRLVRELLDSTSLGDIFSINRDIFLRTLFLLLSFFWFTNQSAQQGETVLAANQILLALVSFSAFFLDGFAYIAEAEVGRHYSRKHINLFRRAVRLTTEAAAMTAFSLGGLLWLFDNAIISMITNITDVKAQALDYLPFAVTYIICSFFAFQLDGIFIGTLKSQEMRNASIISFLGFIASYYALTYIEPANGLWLSFIAYVLLRAASLARYYPRLVNTMC